MMNCLFIFQITANKWLEVNLKLKNQELFYVRLVYSNLTTERNVIKNVMVSHDWWHYDWWIKRIDFS